MDEPKIPDHASVVVQQIAATHLKVTTFEMRYTDSWDFVELSRASLKDALEAAYLAGMNSENDQLTGHVELVIEDLMRGFSIRNADSLLLIAGYSYWQRLAATSLDQRAMCFLDLMPDSALRAIADGAVSLPDIARRLRRQ